MKHNTKYFSFYLLFIYCSLLFTDCKKKDADEDLPMPPSSSLDMEALSDFTAKKISDQSPDSTHFLLAFQYVHTWDSMAVQLLQVPKIIFNEAAKIKAVYNAITQTWTRTYNLDILGDGTYRSVLSGMIKDDSVSWKMTVSRFEDEGFINFVWYEGNSDTKRTGGWWRLYDPICKQPYLFIRWKQENEKIKWITYANIIGDNPDKGSYIKYGTSDDNTDYNNYFEIYVARSSENVRIEWNQPAFFGQITCEGSSGKKWDSNGRNE